MDILVQQDKEKVIEVNPTILILGDATKPIVLEITLLAANWALNVQTLVVAGATGTNLLIITPKNNFTDRDNWANADIIPTAQGVDTVTFTCATTPIANIDGNVLILNTSL